MLILTRKKQEKLMIGDEIEITVLAVRGEQVSIGIKAPRQVSVDREEIYLKKQRKRKYTYQSYRNIKNETFVGH